MPFGTTTIHALRKLTGVSLVSDIDLGFDALASDLDPKLTPWGKGLLSARPISTVGSPGKAGRRYFATDVGVFGCEYVDLGTSWRPTADLVKLDQVTLAAAGSLTFSSIPSGFRSLRVIGSVGSNRAIGGDGYCGLGFIANGITSPGAHFMEDRLTEATVSPFTPSQARSQTSSAARVFAGQIRGNGDANGMLDLLLDLTHPLYASAGVVRYQSVISSAVVGAGSPPPACVSRVTGAFLGSGPVTSLLFRDDTDFNLALDTTLALYGVV